LCDVKEITAFVTSVFGDTEAQRTIIAHKSHQKSIDWTSDALFKEGREKLQVLHLCSGIVLNSFILALNKIPTLQNAGY
jgi:hypothetical protein